MKFAIIGSGAVGAYYGALLLKANYDVHFLFNSDFDHIRTNGLRIDSPNGDLHFPQVNAYNDTANMPAVDVVIVALKSTANHLLEELLSPLLKNNPTIVVLQNGLDAEKDIAAFASNSIILGGLCFLCSNKIAPGHIQHLDYGDIRLGQFSESTAGCGITPEVQKITNAFTNAGVKIIQAENLVLARWQKLVWNIAYNGLCVVLNATTDLVMKDNATRNLVTRLMRETIAGAKACGYEIEDSFIAYMQKLTDDMVAYKPSMLLDYENKRPLEIEYIYQRPLADALEAGYDMTTVRTLTEQLLFIDGQRKRNTQS